MRVQLRMNYEMNRQLQRDSGLSLAHYHVLNQLSMAPDHTLQITELGAMIGWERSRVSHQVRRLCERGLARRVQSEDDGRATDAVLTKKGLDAIAAAAPEHVALVNKLFFDPLPDELVSPFAAALEQHSGQSQPQSVAPTRTSLSRRTTDQTATARLPG